MHNTAILNNKTELDDVTPKQRKLIDYTVERCHRHPKTKQTKRTIAATTTNHLIRPQKSARTIDIPSFHSLEKIPYGSIPRPDNEENDVCCVQTQDEQIVLPTRVINAERKKNPFNQHVEEIYSKLLVGKSKSFSVLRYTKPEEQEGESHCLSASCSHFAL
mmetsp:Transcript_11363/g.17501  ORF Transcript_11363/g.17501 Transcript_11363/m.17501 type:complete len:161 (+) Transcript_11363:157-639(+)